MNFKKIVLSVALLCALPVHADNDDAGRIIGGVIGGIIGGAIGAGQGGPVFGGPGGPPGPGWGHGPGGPGGGPGWGHGPGGGWGGPGWGHGPGGGWGGPGHGGPGFPGPGFPPPGPGPGPGPGMNDLCTGYFNDGQGSSVQFNMIGRGGISVTALAHDGGTYYGQGSCYQQDFNNAQYNFTLQFNGYGHMNQGQIFRGRDGRVYMQGSQDNGPMYTYWR